MDAKYFKVLEYLYPDGVGVSKNISPALRELYPNIDPKNFDRARFESGNVSALLRGMQKSNLIEYRDFSLGSGNKTGGVSWLDTTPINATLTQYGKEAFDNEINKGETKRLTESTIETNQSVRDTNFATIQNMRFQKASQLCSLILAGLSVLFIGISAYLQYQDKTAAKVQDLQQQLQKTSDTIKQLELSLKEINSSIQKLKTD